ncbi:protein kinase domain-containing protein [Zavarzinella formosa]|uniref:protein kinase domain-containing protein n=1 Tax=Zavarzinella formosa TaxID=360055 RepID=UPI00035CED0F|nr:protein kinase [Zavarzinella formosa]
MLQIIGRGGFGVVFRAFDEVLHRVVAVKALSPQMAATSPARKRFVREARSSAGVRHENMVQVYEVGEQPLPYIAMEFIPGETLQQRLDRDGPIDVLDVLGIGRQIAAGLAAAHAADLIHRDIKPANIMLEGGTRRVRITDFGLARAADDASITQSGMIAGTPMYMAPEQATGEPLDQRADLFSLGSVLYVMVSGRPPFRANGALAVLRRVVEDTPRPIREIIPETPSWLCDIISKLHAKNPEERYKSAREVAGVLADCEARLKANPELGELPPAPPPEKPALTVARSGRRKRATIVALLLSVVTLGVTEAAGVTHLFRERPPKTDSIQPQDGPPIELAKGPPDGTINPTTKASPPPAVHLFTDADARRIAALPPIEQAGEVRKELKRLNPDFDGAFRPVVKDDAVTELYFCTDYVTDISPVRALPRLQILSMKGSRVGRGSLVDLSPLKGMVLVDLNLANNKIRNLAPLQGMPLKGLDLWQWVGTDMKPLQGMPLKMLNGGGGNQMLDLMPLAGLPLEYLCVNYTKASDLAPLRGIPLRWVEFTNTNVTDVSPLREVKTLESINRQPSTKFWQMVDAKKNDPAPPMADPGPDRKAAEYVLSVGRTLRINGRDDEISNRARLPGGTFRLTSVSLIQNQQVTNAGLDVFKDCRDLTHVVLLDSKNVTDAGLAHFRGCQNLIRLDLNGTNVTDAGLACFKVCANITTLALPHTVISDRGLLEFPSLKNLTLLDLCGCRNVTGAGLARFTDSKNLTFLGLEFAGVTDDDLARFADCKKLATLRLGGTKITNAGLAGFKDCKNIVIISLGNTPVTDAGLACLKDRKNLTQLQLNNTSVTDTGLAELTGLNRLTKLGLTKAKGVNELAKALPNCQITWDGGRTGIGSDRGCEWRRQARPRRRQPLRQQRHHAAESYRGRRSGGPSVRRE